MRYIDEFLDCRSSADMIDLKIFPNAKEVTESFATYEAVRHYLSKHFHFSDKEVILLSVGDGATPRTGATFAFRSAWTCHSIDPVSRTDRHKYKRVQRLTLHKKRIEDCSREDFGITDHSRVVCVNVHSHAPMDKVLNVIGKVDRLGIVTMPCCVPLRVPYPNVDCYRDRGVLSPHNLIEVFNIKDLTTVN